MASSAPTNRSAQATRPAERSTLATACPADHRARLRRLDALRRRGELAAVAGCARTDVLAAANDGFRPYRLDP